jgi:hypothetical protein
MPYRNGPVIFVIRREHLCEEFTLRHSEEGPHMTMQSVWTSAFVADTPVRKVSFWRRLVISIMEGRQRKADEFMRHYLEMHGR